MDGQNFQNGQDNQNSQTSGSTENTYSGGYQESSYQSNTSQDNNNYQSNTYQDSSNYQNNNYQSNTYQDSSNYQSNNYQNNTYQDSSNYQSNNYQNNTYQDSNNYQSSAYQSNNNYQGNNYQDNTQNYYSSTYAEPAASTEASTPGLAVASLVMGIVSIVLSCCCGVGIVFAVAGIIMAISANKQVKTSVATAGLICSIVGAAFSLLGLAGNVLMYMEEIVGELMFLGL